MKFLIFLIFFIISGCATTENAYYQKGANEYEFWSLSKENIYAGSFYLCKNKHSSGFEAKELQKKGDVFMFQIFCKGSIDQSNAGKYSNFLIQTERYDNAWMRYKVVTP